MTDLLPMLTEYRAGLEAEIAMLRHLVALADREHETASTRAFEELDALTDTRDRVMATLVTVESQLRPLRAQLLEARDRLSHLEEFQHVVALHREAAALAEQVVAVDAQSMSALREAETARRLAADSIEKGESTLAAYRRVVVPDLANATLVNRKG